MAVSVLGFELEASVTYVPLVVVDVLQQRREGAAVHLVGVALRAQPEDCLGDAGDPPRTRTVVRPELLVSVVSGDAVLAHEHLVADVVVVPEREVAHRPIWVLNACQGPIRDCSG